MYVGKGTRLSRPFSHWKSFLRIGQATNALLRRWFEKLKAEGVEPAWRFLEENVENWQEAEKTWIAGCRVINPDLCNVADGGNSFSIESSKIGGMIGGKRVHQVYPNMAYENGEKGKRFLNLANEKAKEFHRKNPEHAKAAGRKGAIVTNSKPHSKDLLKKAGKIGAIRLHQLHPERIFLTLHNRWHRDRSIKKFGCKFCEEINVTSATK